MANVLSGVTRDLNKENEAITDFTFKNNRPPSGDELWSLATSIYQQGANQPSSQQALKTIDDNAYNASGVEKASANKTYYDNPANYQPAPDFDKGIESDINSLNEAIKAGDFAKSGELQKGLIAKTGVKSSYTKAFLAGRKIAEDEYDKALARYKSASEMEKEGYKLDQQSKVNLAENLFKAATSVQNYKIAANKEARDAEMQPLKVKDLQASINKKQSDASNAIKSTKRYTASNIPQGVLLDLRDDVKSGNDKGKLYEAYPDVSPSFIDTMFGGNAYSGTQSTDEEE